MLKYKIGEVSKLLGIPIDTLRYYESRGLVNPQKDDESGYRYYDSWDMNFLLDSKWYRSFELPLAIVEKLINEDDLGQQVMHCVEQESALLEKINHYQQVLQALAVQRQRINEAPGQLGKSRVEARPELLYLRYRFRNEFNRAAQSQPFFRQWANLMPYVNHTFEIPRSSVLTANEDEGEYFWGLSLPPREAPALGVALRPPAEYIPSRKCYYTQFSAGEKGSFLPDFHDQVILPMEQLGYTVSGNSIGHLITRVHRNGKLLRYFEVWVPIE